MSVVDTFKSFRDSLVITEDELNFNADCRRKVISHLNAFFWTNNSDSQNAIEYGSYVRGTAVFGASDIDIGFKLPVEIFARFDAMEVGRQSAILELVQSTLKDLDPDAEIRPLSGSVSFSVEGNEIIDVRPYFSIGGKDIYPDVRSKEEWRTFSADLSQRTFEAKNTETKENLAFICRAARCWRRTMNAPISGFLIDSLAYEFIDKSLYRAMAPIYQDCLIRDFFGYMAQLDPEQEFWFAPGSTESVLRTGPFEEVADQAYALSEQAIDHSRNRQDRQSWAKWREIFGEKFVSP